MRRLGHQCRFFATAAAWLCITAACGDANDPQAMLVDYVERVENVTDAKASARAFASSLLSYPDRRDRRLPLTDVRINLLEFLGLIQCGLQEIVGERNSSLGKVMPVSQQLVYEHRLLVGARQCRRELAEKDSNLFELQQTLDEIIAIKTADLPRAYWNATFGSPEFEHMFSLAAAPLRIDAAGRSNPEIERALLHLANLGSRLGDATLELESARLEAHYKALTSQRLAGELLGALELLRHYLDAAAGAIETRLERRPMCFDRRPTPAARNLNNVFHKYYVAQVQPYLAQVHRQTRGWLEPINRLAGAQAALTTPAFATYFDVQLSLDAPDALWTRYEASLRRHTRAWQTILGQCGLMPGT